MLEIKADYRQTLILMTSNYYNWLQAFGSFFYILWTLDFYFGSSRVCMIELEIKWASASTCQTNKWNWDWASWHSCPNSCDIITNANNPCEAMVHHLMSPTHQWAPCSWYPGPCFGERWPQHTPPCHCRSSVTPPGWGDPFPSARQPGCKPTTDGRERKEHTVK